MPHYPPMPARRRGRITQCQRRDHATGGVIRPHTESTCALSAVADRSWPLIITAGPALTLGAAKVGVGWVAYGAVLLARIPEWLRGIDETAGKIDLARRVAGIHVVSCPHHA